MSNRDSTMWRRCGSAIENSWLIGEEHKKMMMIDVKDTASLVIVFVGIETCSTATSLGKLLLNVTPMMIYAIKNAE